MGPQSITILSVCGVVTYLLLIIRTWPAFSGRTPFPDGVRLSSAVGVGAAAFGGLSTSLGWLNITGPDMTTVLAATWRAALLVALMYGLLATFAEGPRD